MWANAVTISRCARLKGIFSGLQMLPCYQKVSPEVPVICNDFVASHQAKNNTEENLLKLQFYILLKILRLHIHNVGKYPVETQWSQGVDTSKHHLANNNLFTLGPNIQ